MGNADDSWEFPVSTLPSIPTFSGPQNGVDRRGVLEDRVAGARGHWGKDTEHPGVSHLCPRDPRPA